MTTVIEPSALGSSLAPWLASTLSSSIHCRAWAGSPPIRSARFSGPSRSASASPSLAWSAAVSAASAASGVAKLGWSAGAGATPAARREAAANSGLGGRRWLRDGSGRRRRWGLDRQRRRDGRRLGWRRRLLDVDHHGRPARRHLDRGNLVRGRQCRRQLHRVVLWHRPRQPVHQPVRGVGSRGLAAAAGVGQPTGAQYGGVGPLRDPEPRRRPGAVDGRRRLGLSR